MKFEKIIVPIDFSEHSEYALEAAAILAKQYNSEILALPVGVSATCLPECLRIDLGNVKLALLESVPEYFA